MTVSGPVEHAAERLSRVRDVVGLPIRPAEVRELSRKGNRAELSVIIHEGRNRQIRRMCAAVGLHVKRLCGSIVWSLGRCRWGSGGT